MRKPRPAIKKTRTPAAPATRRAWNPTVEFPSELPISQHVGEIADALTHRQVVIVAGETGSGKTTQLPKICLQAGFGQTAMIGHTQPRRIAARATASRIAEELKVALGQQVGFAVRFTDQVAESTAIKVMTDGLLLTEIRRDRKLSRYDAIIVDEAHERSLNIDFLLGYLKKLLPKRRGLKLIITSATIDVDRFAEHFGEAPVIEVSGRGHPVETHHLEPSEDEQADLLRAIEAIEAAPKRAAEDLLVFQTGEREIFESAKFLRKALAGRFEILPLYARLSASDQQRVFQPGAKRRIVLATNVAETSITVPNIGFVVDPGKARINRYSYRSKLQRLPIEPISQASADQRRGRCGRIGPGLCVRLYSEEDYSARPAYSEPEIKRVNLASVVLQMRAFGLGDIERFPFLDPPERKAVKDALTLLHELGALVDGKLTAAGRAMARFPLDPRLGRMLIAAAQFGALREVSIIAAALAVPDPRERPLNASAQADQAHAAFADERSDFMTLLNLWAWLEKTRQGNTRRAMTAALRSAFLNPARIREWREVHRQLLAVQQQLGLRLNQKAASYAEIHQALLPGTLSLVARHDERGAYLGARHLQLRIFPGSCLAGRTPAWIMAAEVSETQRVYARNAAAIDARWLETAASHLLRRTYSDPHWSAKRGEAMVYETLLLYGLKIVERRPVRYAPIDGLAARQILIRDGLVGGELGEDVRAHPLPFLKHNRRLAAEILDWEEKGRRRDLLASEAVQCAFYDQRLPPEVTGLESLRNWLRQGGERADGSLRMARADLLSGNARQSADDYPARLVLAGAELRLHYRFAPGEADDGVNLDVPVGALQAIDEQDLAWSVPGFLAPLVEAWLRSLPKATRRQLAPIAATAQRITPALAAAGCYRQSPFKAALANAIEDQLGVRVAPAAWNRAQVPTHLLMNVRVIDKRGTLLAQGRDLAELQRRFLKQARERVAAGTTRKQEQQGLTAFPADGVPAKAVLAGSADALVGYPALVDRGDAVDLRICTTRREQAEANRAGYPRLAWLSLAKPRRFFERQLVKAPALVAHASVLGGTRELIDSVMLAVAWRCYFQNHPLPTTQEAYDALLKAERPKLADVFNETVSHLGDILEARAGVVARIARLTSPAFRAARDDVQSQVQALTPPDLLQRTPGGRLPDVARFLRAADHRLTNLQGRTQRDATRMAQIKAFETRLVQLDAKSRESEQHAGNGESSAELGRDMRFDLEELRVALFAEPLARKGMISVKKMEQRLLDAERAAGLR